MPKCIHAACLRTPTSKNVITVGTGISRAEVMEAVRVIDAQTAAHLRRVAMQPIWRYELSELSQLKKPTAGS